MLDESALEDIADRLLDVDGVEAVTLGGSRARGTHGPRSDIDLGVYRRGDLDLDALRDLAFEITGRVTPVTEPGAWGPWVDGGAWLEVDGVAVDWIHRSLDRVEQVRDDCLRGVVTREVQLGHPHGFWSHAYVGEVVLGRVLGDPSGALASVAASVADYPEPLRRTLLDHAGRARFDVHVARSAAERGDVAFVAGAAFDAVGLLLQGAHAHERRWLVHEKGALAAARTLEACHAEFADMVETVFANLRADTENLVWTVNLLAVIVDDTLTRLGPGTVADR